MPLDSPHPQIEATWVKSFRPGAGAGGDWALRLDARKAANVTHAADELEGGPVSLFFYVYLEQQPECGYRAASEAASDSAPQNASPWRFITGLFNRQRTDGPRKSAITKPSMQIQHLADDRGVVRGASPQLGNWALFATDGRGGAIHDLRFIGLQAPSAHNVTDELRLHLSANRRGRGQQGLPQLINGAMENPNLAVFQVSGALPFTIDLAFVGGDAGDEILYPSRAGEVGAATDVYDAIEPELDRLQNLQGSQLTKLIQRRERDFEERFDALFTSSLNHADGHPASIEAAKAALSNTLGSIGFFHGCSIVRRMPDERPPAGQQHPRLSLYGPSSLLSGVPSRSFFPRGFLWDEGFHQLLVSRWDADLSRLVIAHWLDLMDKDGWIPREQILGAEARARVPDQFVAQDPSAANPPSMILALEHLLDAANQGIGDPARTLAFLKRSWPRLEGLYNWYNTTQSGGAEGTYRWRGRDAHARELNPKTLTSGLDDFPRASHPSDSERHLDLRCWMAIASRIMAKIGSAVGADAADVHVYQRTHALLSDFGKLNELHYHKGSGRYLDYGLHTEDIELRRIAHDTTGHTRLERAVSTKPKLKKVPHFGYISLFPLISLLLPPSSPQLQSMLRQIRDPELLWTNYGLRSLSKDSSLYNRGNTFDDAPYWRGPIWININFLTLSALHKYAGLDQRYAGGGGEFPNLVGEHVDEAKRVYSELRAAVVGNIVRQYHETGYLWEHYDDVDGHGKGTHPFTGWTALAVLIMGESYP